MVPEGNINETYRLDFEKLSDIINDLERMVGGGYKGIPLLKIKTHLIGPNVEIGAIIDSPTPTMIPLGRLVSGATINKNPEYIYLQTYLSEEVKPRAKGEHLVNQLRKYIK